MNRPSESAPRRRLHPLLGAAAVSVIILSAVAVAAMTGVLPNLSAGSSPQAAASAQEAALAGPEAAPACATCGVVEGIRTVQVPVRDDSNHLIGTVAGGVVGGVVGNQFGGGHGRDALTVLGAVGGALAGREVERNIREQQTVTHYELTVRMSDGSRRQFRSAQPFAFASGDRVRVENDQLLPG
ncbi:glycine zipper 2TM domain-containing protein [Bordetella pertussis]|uniref:glycine zipper 2TM domain-containing protein n=1 Tax=Bordetella pertussis TaxID=520 RepID=UPI0005EA1DF6|nr:glycine zipper 2TM domain-containing protein [Bordetella pertussis]CPK75992.1 Surface antigen [Bordetella pertussis]